MDKQYAQAANELNACFYQRVAASFSQTRQQPWAGWERLLPTIEDACSKGIRCVDLGCGNMRFARYLSQQLPGLALTYTGIDSCDDLVPEQTSARYRHCDIVSALIEGTPLFETNDAHPNLIVAFGLMHHIPTPELRRQLVRTCIDELEPGGLLVLTLWQFMNDPRLAAKASALDEQPPFPLQTGDHLLGWQDDRSAIRLCHHFDEAEVDELLGDVAADAACINRFHADGKHADLNCYTVLRKAAR